MSDFAAKRNRRKSTFAGKSTFGNGDALSGVHAVGAAREINGAAKRPKDAPADEPRNTAFAKKRNIRKSMHVDKLLLADDDPLFELDACEKREFRQQDEVPPREVGKRIKTAKKTFDPSPVMITRRRQTIGELPKKRPVCAPPPEKKMKLPNAPCDRCNTLLDETVVVCNLCQRQRVHAKCVRRQEGPSDRWQCRSCADLITKLNPSLLQDPQQTKATPKTPPKDVNGKSPQSEFAGFSPNELHTSDKLHEHMKQLKESSMEEEATEPVPPSSTTENPIETIKVPVISSVFSIHVPPAATLHESCQQSTLNNNNEGVWSPFGLEPAPDCGTWSVQQVYEYFLQFFPHTAYVMQDAEIDGYALKLMTRKDMLTMVHQRVPGNPSKFVPLRLGEALKMYSHILRLQTLSNDLRLGWNV